MTVREDGSRPRWSLWPDRAWRAVACVAALAFVLPAAVSAQNLPEQDGMRFNRLAAKTRDVLAAKAGGPTERIEIQSTDDHRDYVVKAYVLEKANASEVFELIQTAVELEGGFVSRIAPGSVCTVTDEDTMECRTEYTGESMLVVTVPEWMIEYLDQTIEILDQEDLAASATGTGGLYARVKHRLPSEVAEMIAETAASPFAVLHADDDRQILYIEDTPSYFEGDLEALKVFDVSPPQIETRVRIYELNEDDATDVGLDWYAWKKSISGGSLDLSWDNSSNPGSYNLDLESLSAELSFSPVLATEFLNYLVSNGKASVITDSRLTQINRVPATIASVTNLPFIIGGFIDGDVSDSPLRDSPEALDPDRLIKEFSEGIVVEITPQIAEDIELEIHASVTSHVGYTPNQHVPIMTESSVESTVLLLPGKAAVLGGLTRKSTVIERSGIPLLKEVPLLKYLVSRQVKREHRSHIIITISLDHVIAGGKQFVENTDALPPAR